MLRVAHVALGTLAVVAAIGVLLARARRARRLGANGAASSAPELLYLGHAGFLYSWQGVTVLLDPWFFPAFAGSWFPWPDNRFLLERLQQRRVDFVYLSHR